MLNKFTTDPDPLYYWTGLAWLTLNKSGEQFKQFGFENFILHRDCQQWGYDNLF